MKFTSNNGAALKLRPHLLNTLGVTKLNAETRVYWLYKS